MKFLYTILLFITCSGLIFAQSIRPKDLVQQKKGSFEQVNMLSLNESRSGSKEFESLENYSLLSIDLQAIKKLPSALSLKVPLTSDTNLDLQLVEVDIFSDDHLAIEEPSGRLITANPGKHYRGLIKDLPNSLVSISIYDDEISGFISHPKHAGNFVIGKLQAGKKSSADHIVYLDSDMTFDRILDCSTADEGESYTEAELQAPSNNRALSDCVRLLLEVDFNLHQELGSSTTASNNYINSLFNSVSTIYAGENINTTLSASFVWSSSSPYSGSNAGTLLSTYQSNRNNFNADFAQLLNFQNIGGVAATINGVCKTENNRMCVSGVVNNIEALPAFSFDVIIATHEYGHLFGSFHTHGCYWNGNNTQIDDCGNKVIADRGQTPEGAACYNGNNLQYPNNGGTIMSYCYAISGVGVNFANGFGDQPGNAIRNRVANGSCLQACGNTGGGCTENELELTINTDQYGSETTWDVTNASGTTVASGGPYSGNNTTFTEEICIPDGCYTFTINDEYGDGICCQYGNGSYTLRASDGSVIKTGGNFTTSETTNFCEGGGNPPTGGSCVEIDFDDYNAIAYGNGQDNGTATELANGDGISIFSNAWKSIALNYTVTANTKISFEFGSTAQGEIHGLGFDNDSALSSGRTFQFYGTQNWGNRDFDYTTPGNWQAFTIPVGQYYTGNFNRLFFVADHDGGAQNGNTYVRFIKIYEGASCASSQGIAENVVLRNGMTAMVDGLPDDNLSYGMTIYPNPAASFVNVAFDGKSEGEGSIEVFNLLGQKVHSQNVSLVNGSNVFRINSARINTGSYMLKLTTRDQEYVEKLTISK